MGQIDSNLIVSEERLNLIRRYIAAHIPFVPQGQKIVLDKKALENLLPEHIAEFLPSLRPEECEQLKNNFLKQFNRVAGDIPFHASELEDEADQTKRTLLMAGLEKLGGYSIEEKLQMFKEWFCIRHALVKSGAHLEIIPSSANEGGSQEVYTRDRYVMIGDTAYLPDPQKLDDIPPSRYIRESLRGEITQTEKALNERGIKTVMAKGAWFEGGNVVRHFSSKTIFFALDRVWSTEDSAQKLLSAVNGEQSEKWSLLPVPLANRSEMYHLDTGMSEELPHGEVMLSPLVTDKKTYQQIVDIVGAENVIELSDNDARSMATNMIDVGDTLVMTSNCNNLREELKEKGYNVVMPEDYGQQSFEIGHGGVHCMTNDLRQPRRKQPAPRASAMTRGM